MLRSADIVALPQVEMAAPHDPQDSTAPRSLASADLPRRVRRILERALALFSEEMERHLVFALTDFEDELFRFADRSGTTGGGRIDYLQTLRVVRMNRHDIVPRFVQLIESGLAGIRAPALVAPARAALVPPQPLNFRNLSLVDESVMDEGAVLHAIASRQEAKVNLVLHLLGQRFGVLAAAPAFDSERNPLGPQALCRAVSHAIEGLHLEHDARLLFFRVFDRRVMAHYPALCEKLDAMMVDEGLLPGLSYVPMRSRGGADENEAGPRLPEPGGDGTGSESRTPQGREPAAAGPGGAGFGHGGGMLAGVGEGVAHERGSGAGGAGAGVAREGVAGEGAASDEHRPHTVWMGQPLPRGPVDEQKAFHDLQQMLNQRRTQSERLNPIPPGQRPEVSIPTRDLLQTLGRMDAEPELPGGINATVADIKQSLLAQARQQHGKAVALNASDNDTFDLIGLLYNHLQSEIRNDAPAAALVKRLQLTLLRVALQDRGFFVSPNHPARQLLSTVSETAAKWLADDDIDPQLLAPLQQAVTHAIKHYDGDVSVFEQSNKQLRTHIDAQVRRAETMERRHVEAARGKEKLEAAKLRTEQVLAETIGDAPLPKFTRALLNQAWADVLTLTYLRHGEGSEEWNRQIEATRQVIDACTHREDGAEQPALKAHVEKALKQVGYHEDEADVIARRLSSSLREDEDGESRTELTMKLKARVRLGEDAQKARKPDLPPRTAREQECYEHLRLLPFGTWLEFVTNQQGDVVRRRMSWFSPVTGHALFVNQRGQRVGEHSLDSLARMMAKDQVRVVTVQRAGLVDRAWNAALSALRSLTGRREEQDGDDEPVGADIAVRSTPAAPLDGAPEDAPAVRSVPSARAPESAQGPDAVPPQGDAR
jgi:hypothetical protein